MSIEFIAVITFTFLVLVASGIFIVYYQLRRQWFDHQFEHRKIRQKNYRLLIHDISEAATQGDDESHQKLMARLDSLLVVASPYSLPLILEFQKFMRVSNTRVLRNSEIWLEQRDELSRILIQFLREDIYGYEPKTAAALSEWRPLSRTIRKPGIRLEVIPFRGSSSNTGDSEYRQRK